MSINKYNPDFGYYLAEKAVKDTISNISNISASELNKLVDFSKQEKPENFFRIYLAEKAVKDTVSNISNISASELNELVDFCKQEKSENFFRILLKFQREKINRIIIKMVINELMKIQQKFIFLRYQKQLSFIQISFELHVSEGQLYIWNKQFINEIQAMLFYTLTEEAIFSQTKVLNMVNIIDYRIAFLQKNNSICSKKYLDCLLSKRKNYRELLTIIRKHMYDIDVEKAYDIIIATKLNNPELNRSEIANLCGLSLSMVCRKLNLYKIVASQYI